MRMISLMHTMLFYPGRSKALELYVLESVRILHSSFGRRGTLDIWFVYQGSVNFMPPGASWPTRMNILLNDNHLHQNGIVCFNTFVCPRQFNLESCRYLPTLWLLENDVCPTSITSSFPAPFLSTFMPAQKQYHQEVNNRAERKICSCASRFRTYSSNSQNASMSFPLNAPWSRFWRFCWERHYTEDSIVAVQRSRSEPRRPEARASPVDFENFHYMRTMRSALLLAIFSWRPRPRMINSTSPQRSWRLAYSFTPKLMLQLQLQLQYSGNVSWSCLLPSLNLYSC